MTTAKVFNFAKQLAMSETDHVHELVERAVRQRLPELLNIHRAHAENDKQGIDFWLEFPNGCMEKLDVKIRAKDYATPEEPENICLEIVANTTTNKPGWTKDMTKLTDWVLFLWLDTGRSDLVHARQLRSAANGNMPSWQATKRTSAQVTETRTGSYASTSLFVSSHDIWAAIFRLFSYDGSRPGTSTVAPNDSSGGKC
jgi:hypothetical protein